MKYYSEEDTKQLRLGLEEEVLRWPGAVRGKMFGVPCYLAGGKLFAFLVTKGVVITKLDQAERDAVSAQPNASAFRSANRVYRKWVRLSIDDPKDMDGLMPLLRKSYEAARC